MSTREENARNLFKLTMKNKEEKLQRSGIVPEIQHDTTYVALISDAIRGMNKDGTMQIVNLPMKVLTCSAGVDYTQTYYLKGIGYQRFIELLHELNVDNEVALIGKVIYMMLKKISGFTELVVIGEGTEEDFFDKVREFEEKENFNRVKIAKTYEERRNEIKEKVTKVNAKVSADLQAESELTPEEIADEDDASGAIVDSLDDME